MYWWYMYVIVVYFLSCVFTWNKSRECVSTSWLAWLKIKDKYKIHSNVNNISKHIAASLFISALPAFFFSYITVQFLCPSSEVNRQEAGTSGRQSITESERFYTTTCQNLTYHNMFKQSFWRKIIQKTFSITKMKHVTNELSSSYWLLL